MMNILIMVSMVLSLAGIIWMFALPMIKAFFLVIAEASTRQPVKALGDR